jgi:hypothetical protein
MKMKVKREQQSRRRMKVRQERSRRRMKGRQEQQSRMSKTENTNSKAEGERKKIRIENCRPMHCK